MTGHVNHLGQPIGFPVAGWEVRRKPPRTPMAGRFCRIEPLDPQRHARDLHAANTVDRDGRMWTYLPHGPYADFDDYLASLKAAAPQSEDCCCLEISWPSTSRTRSFKPCLSV